MPHQEEMLGERYVLEERIASGGMASVWRARDVVLARTVACKLLHPHLAEDASFVERFRIEALAAARLSHPNIVAIYDTGSDEGDNPKHFIVMEYCSEGTLAQLLSREGPLEPARVGEIGSTICSALAYAHSHEVIHRDIKPHNVLLSEHGSLKVTDFGIAKAAFATKDITTTGAIIGTVTYISPEQAQGTEPDARSDLYALGIVLYELVVGKPPFRAETDVATALMHVNQAPMSPRSMRAGVPRDLDAVIMKALAKDPEDRFDSAASMRDALGGASFKAERAERTQEIRAAPPPVSDDAVLLDELDTERPRSESRRMSMLLLLIAAAIIAAVAIGTLLNQTDPEGGDEPPNTTGNAQPVKITAARDFDPGGSPPEEHSELVPLAWDGDPATSWTTENYTSSILSLKEGVGLLFDLGDSRSIQAVEVAFDRADYAFELRAGDQEGSDQDAFDLVDSLTNDGAQVTIEANTEARYWLIWITALPGGGGGRGAIAEVSFLGS